jgi:hypothetical protein
VGNFRVFSQAPKCWPFVLPDGRIAVFVSDGRHENSGVLAGSYSDPFGAYTTMAASLDSYAMRVKDFVVQGDGSPLIFENKDTWLCGYTLASKVNELANAKKTTVAIHPIPFTAANGIEWKGSAVTTGMGTLPQTLDDLRDQLSKVPSWSFDSDHWAGTDWKEFRYSMQMHPSYIGLVDELENVFGSAP